MQAVRPGRFGKAKQRVWAGNLFPKQSGTKWQKLKGRVKPALKIYCRKVSGTWHRVDAELL